MLCCDWLSRKTIPQSFSAAKIDPGREMCPPYWLASSEGQRIFINIRGQCGIQKNIYIHPWLTLNAERCICVCVFRASSLMSRLLRSSSHSCWVTVNTREASTAPWTSCRRSTRSFTRALPTSRWAVQLNVTYFNPLMPTVAYGYSYKASCARPG